MHRAAHHRAGFGNRIAVPPEGLTVFTLVPGDRSHLLPGAAVNLTAATGADGSMTATRIQVSK